MSYTLLLLNVLAIKYITSINDSQESTKIDSFQNKLASTIIPAAGISKEFDADEKLFSFSENGLFVGYYHDHYWNDLNGFAFNLSHSEDPNTCFNMCENKGFEYAAIRFINSLYFACFCDNKYGTSKITNTNIQHISTFCSSFPIKCGKNSFNKVVNVKERNTNMEVIGTVSGCYSIKMYSNYSYVDSQSSCLKNCLEKSLKTAVLNLENHCICEGFYDGLENNEDLNCPNCTNENCAKYNGFLLNASYNEMEIRCPKTAFTGLEFNCSVTIKKPSEYTVIIDFGTQNKSLVINAVKFPFDFTVNYSSPGHYLLKVNVENHKINVQTTIYVYDDDNSILTIDEKKEFIYKEKGIYLGCFYDQNYFHSKNEEIRSFNENNMTTEFCFDNCKEADYQYAILKNSFECYCSNKYGMEGVRKDHECNCVCFGKLEDFCGCRNTYRVYSLKNKWSDTIYAASYEGCFNLNHNVDANFITFNTNGICLRRCRNSQYFLTFKKNFCICTNSLEEYKQISEKKCDLSCPGNSSQICGSFLASSVYKIKMTKLEISCSELIVFDRQLNCTIELISNATIEIDIKFKENHQKMTLAPNSNNSLTATLSFSSFYEFEISSSNSSLLIFPLIFVFEPLNRKNITPIDTIEIFEKSEYIGCLESIKTDTKNNKISLNYQNCSEYCSLRHFQYLTLTNDKDKNLWCECASNIKSENYENIKNCLCSHEKLTNFFSSCLNKFKIHKSSNKNKVIFLANYVGCFKFDKKSEMITLGFLNNHLCIQFCVYNKFKYAATSKKTNCYCSNETITQDKIEEEFCSLPCNGNQSQFCGGLSAGSVYEIKELRLIIDCPKSVVQFENLICSIDVSFKYQQSIFLNVSIEFGDKTSQTFDIYTDALMKILKLTTELVVLDLRLTLLAHHCM